MSSPYGLTPQIVDAINQVIARYTKVAPILYGSRAKGSFREGSDIDLVLKDSQLTTRDLLKIENDLDDLMLPYKIDLSLFHQIDNKDLIDHIERVGKVFYAERE